MIQISTKQATKELADLKDQLSERNVATATRMAMNEAIKSGKTQVRRTIREMYNINNSRIESKDTKKGLSVKNATNDNLEAQITAGHIPVNLSEANPKFKGEVVATKISYGKDGKVKKGRNVVRSKTKISVEVKKGERKTLETAFTIARGTSSNGSQFLTPAIFARGKKGKPDFKFNKDRLPIDSMSTVSVATAALNTDAQQKNMPKISDTFSKRLEHHMKRMIDKK